MSRSFADGLTLEQTGRGEYAGNHQLKLVAKAESPAKAGYDEAIRHGSNLPAKLTISIHAIVRSRRHRPRSSVATITSRAAREAERRRLREATLAAAGRAALTGGWYWAPLPRGDRVEWRVQAFYDGWRSHSDHVLIWRHVRDSLAHHWRRRLRNIECYALPRGRVSRRTDSGAIAIQRPE